MAEFSDTNRDGIRALPSGAAMTAFDLKTWFVREILPLEAALMQYLQHNWRNAGDITDLRQEVYLRVCEAAAEDAPATRGNSSSQSPETSSSTASAMPRSYPSRPSLISRR